MPVLSPGSLRVEKVYQLQSEEAIAEEEICGWL